MNPPDDYIVHIFFEEAPRLIPCKRTNDVVYINPEDAARAGKWKSFGGDKRFVLIDIPPLKT